ncbi:hypothetical protein HZS_5664 [Henneguya salminicola]|nr:hypothetical protein HZS_5664 [Henneguya salminicola]
MKKCDGFVGVIYTAVAFNQHFPLKPFYLLKQIDLQRQVEVCFQQIHSIPIILLLNQNEQRVPRNECNIEKNYME